MTDASRLRRAAKQTPWNWLCRATGVAPLRGLRPDTNGVPFVPAEGQGPWPCAVCKTAKRVGGGSNLSRQTAGLVDGALGVEFAGFQRAANNVYLPATLQERVGKLAQR